jgi:hypothetical protein
MPYFVISTPPRPALDLLQFRSPLFCIVMVHSHTLLAQGALLQLVLPELDQGHWHDNEHDAAVAQQVDDV